MEQIQQQGFNLFLKEFKLSPKEVKECIPYNQGRHELIKLWNGTKLVLITKKEPFRNFGNIFETKEGYGESINQECLEQYIKLGIDFIIFRYSSLGYCYYIRPIAFYNNCHFREVDKVKPRTRFGETVLEKEYTISISMKELTRLETSEQLKILLAKDGR